MKILLIDRDPFFRSLTRKYLERDLPECELTELDPSISEALEIGPPEEFDIVLLCHELGSHGSGIDWLSRSGDAFRRRIVYLTETRSIDLASHASRLGCRAVLCRSDIKGDRLALVMQTVCESEPLSRSGGLGASPRIEGYRLASRIGEGAMSQVFLAERLQDNVTVVLKIIELDYPNNHAHVRRFVEEAQLVANIDSAHVVRIFEQGFTDAVGFIAMEFFPRGDLKQRIEYGLTPADSVNCLANIAYGLEAIHEAGIVHRDLKPANVMFRHDDTLALADFGISRRLDSPVEGATSVRVLGTPHYMSPEQGRGKAADVRNDLYSLGVMFFEMLTQQKPYVAATPAKVVYQHIHAPIPRLPVGLKRYQPIIDQLLAKNPADRLPSAKDLIELL